MRPSLLALLLGRGEDATAWAAAVRRNGGAVSDARVEIIRAFVAAEKASGAWALTDDYWPLWAENSIQALTSLKQRRLATEVNSPTFTTDRGYAFNGTTQYIDTGFIASTHGTNWTGTNQRGGVYEITNVTSSGTSAGTLDGGSRLTLCNRNSTTAQARLNGSVASITLGVADSRGLKATSRANGSTAVLLYDRGVRLTDGTVASPATTRPARSVYAGAYNNGGSPTSFRAASIGFVVVGGPLSDTQELAQYNAVQAFATSVGANV